MNQPDLIPHLFRKEYGKIVSVLVRYWGINHLEAAEDIASETFVTAVQTWVYRGIPVNPAAWLYQVAKNKARNYLKREQIFRSDVYPEIRNRLDASEQPDLDLSVDSIRDSQLRMMFAISHPSMAPESQIALSLRILCGFGIEEIAAAFLTNKETINKRLLRAKQKLRSQPALLEAPGPAEIAGRMENVLTTLYLLFSEGYYSISKDPAIRKELCLEAMLLANSLLQTQSPQKKDVFALLSLMCFQASRLEARVTASGETVPYEEQDPQQWNMELVSQGIYFLKEASGGDRISRFHLEACIAYYNTIKDDTPEKWENILRLYNILLEINNSPITALNRGYAIYKVKGKMAAIAATEKLRLANNQFYCTLLGELYSGIDNQKARAYYQRAIALAKTMHDRNTLQTHINRLENTAAKDGVLKNIFAG